LPYPRTNPVASGGFKDLPHGLRVYNCGRIDVKKIKKIYILEYTTVERLGCINKKIVLKGGKML